MNIEQEIARRIAPLSPQVFEFGDDSHLHVGHAGNRGGGHYSMLIASEQFDGVSRLNRQRLVKDALADLFQNGAIHALSIRAFTPNEYFNR